MDAQKTSLPLIASIYGYLVCVICIGVFLGSLFSLVAASFDYMNPLRANTVQYSGSCSLSSYDSYSRSLENGEVCGGMAPVSKPNVDGTTTANKPSHDQYDQLVKDRTDQVHFEAGKTITTNIFFILVVVGLFGLHWRWLRKG